MFQLSTATNTANLFITEWWVGTYPTRLLDDITDVDHPELLKEVQECLVEVLAAMLHGQETIHSRSST